ncbi:hypothetical protein O6H91_02G089600 [Diphasiastrum complanatum]|nr:hypothetical protein O6H91_02G089600 [Diphasiastrum complanatum]
MQQVIDLKGDNRITVNYEEFVAGNANSFPLNSSENVTGCQSSRQIPDREMEPSSPVPANLLEQLLDCARAVEADDLEKVNEIVEKLRSETSPTGDCYQRLGFYFVEALVARVWRATSKMCFQFSPSTIEILKAYHLFLETTPYMKIPHYFATQTILKACKGAQRLHIVDYGILYGIQWPALIEALADRPEGPPKLRITGIHFPMPDSKPVEKTELTASRLAEFARRCGVPFEYHSVKAKWDQILPSSLMIRHDEILIVNCMFGLRHLLDETMAAESPRKRVLKSIRAMNPKVFIEGVMNAALNTPLGFIHRFRAVLDHSINTFEAIDASIPWHSPERVHMESQFFAKAIFNVVACEGAERVDRAEPYKYWQTLTYMAGFKMMPIQSTMYRQIEDIMATSFHRNYEFGRDGEWMLLGWKNRPTHAVSAWETRSIQPRTAASITRPSIQH